MRVEVVEVVVRTSVSTRGLNEDIIRKAIQRVFSYEISNNWRFFNGREIQADVM